MNTGKNVERKHDTYDLLRSFDIPLFNQAWQAALSKLRCVG